MSELNPLLSAERQQKLVEQVVFDEFPAMYRNRVKNLMQSRYILGETPPRNKVEELMQLEQYHEMSVQVALDPNSLPGARLRAQLNLQREAKLREAILGENLDTPPA